MDRDKAKVELKEAIEKAFEEGELLWGRNGYCGDETVSLMAEAALSVLLGIEDAYDYMNKEGIING